MSYFNAFIVLALLGMMTHVQAKTNTSLNLANHQVSHFAQLVNHDGNASNTFLQRYQIDTSFFQPGGPILFIQGAASEMRPLSHSDLLDYAPKLGAMVASLEHRSFGESGAVTGVNVSRESFSSLTLENVLQDGVNFVEWIRSNVDGAEDSKVIYTGGSYAGFLAVQARIRHPETFHGAIASSPPLMSFGPLPKNAFRFAAANHMSDVYFQNSPKAAGRIQTAMNNFKQCSEAGDCHNIVADLGLCPAPNATEHEVLYKAAARTYYQVLQYNYPFVEKYPTANPFDDLITMTLAAKSDGQVLRVPLQAATWGSPSKCIDTSSINITNGHPSGAGPSLDYIACTYFPINHISMPANNLLPEAYSRTPANLCARPEWEAAYFNRSDTYFTQKYALSNRDLDTIERLLIVQGGFDPIVAIGTPKLSASKTLNHSRVVVVDGGAHVEDTFSEAVEPRGVRPGLDQIRDFKLDHLEEWLGMRNLTDSASAESPAADLGWILAAAMVGPLVLALSVR